MASLAFLHKVYHVFVDEYPFAYMESHMCVKGHDLNISGKNIDELKILMPVHGLKARVKRITVLVDNIQPQIWKAGMPIEVDRIYIWFHDIPQG